MSQVDIVRIKPFLDDRGDASQENERRYLAAQDFLDSGMEA
jgi:hypothetical protein